MWNEIQTYVVALTMEHVATVAGVVTTVISLVAHYTGWSPKQLPERYQPLPALVLTVAFLEWLALEQYGVSFAVVVAALAAGLVAGAGSNVAHISLQAAARAGKAGRGGVGVALVLSGLAASSIGCAYLEPAKAPVQAACESGLVEAALVQFRSEERGISPAQLAAALCAVPAVLEAFEQATTVRANPVAAAQRAAVTRGLL